METILEVIILYILRYPGAFLRWLYYLGKKKYVDILNDENPNTNTIISIIFITIIVFMFLILK